MTAPKFIVFDCDGTLVDSEYIIAEAMRRGFTAHGFEPIPREAVRRVVGLHLREAVATLAPHLSAAECDAVTESYKQAFYALRTEEDQREPLFDGVLPVLSTLRAAGHSIGLATGKSRRGVDAVFKLHGLAEYFDVVKTADDGPGKPHPQILEDAMAKVGATPADSVVIGDTTFDMELAANARAHAIGVHWGYHEGHELTAAGAAHVLKAFDELPGALAGIWGSG